MLDRGVVREFLHNRFEETEIEVPNDIPEHVLVETFCRYVEDDYYEWLSDNFKSFFEHGDPDWPWIRERIDSYARD